MMGLMMRRRCGEGSSGSIVRPGYWFAQRRYGIGSVPANIAGWVAMSLFLLIFGLTMWAMPTDGARIVVGAGLIVAYLVIVWAKTDGGWRWRWGGA